ncbi:MULTISPECIES: EthD family reductase [Pontibacillus]|uniref:EthD family reductase n=1 Tax=Pontibacillus chungwhensis TaxID=265426 RepID=A0ABY8UXQ2_9BACI|nr:MULTISPECIES: EthD family reductase [Pontibacillus]MCD5323956.1 EthD family reductase [Pontibacillus sp. HN14]WIF97978.1 EthD family reductase [Pontibacillus chungwhensis]
MAKIMVMYPPPTDQQAFKDYYEEIHMPLANSMEGVINTVIHSVSHSVHTKQDVYQVTEIEFDNKDRLQKALASDQWQKVQADVDNLMQYLTEAPGMIITD